MLAAEDDGEDGKECNGDDEAQYQRDSIAA
jgi:hypothetical protein